MNEANSLNLIDPISQSACIPAGRPAHADPYRPSEHAQRGILPLLALEHEELCALAGEAQSGSGALRQRALLALQRRCLTRYLAAGELLGQELLDAIPTLVEEWRGGHELLLCCIAGALERLSDDLVLETQMAIDYVALVLDPQIFLTAAATMGCSDTVELSLPYAHAQEEQKTLFPRAVSGVQELCPSA